MIKHTTGDANIVLIGLLFEMFSDVAQKKVRGLQINRIPVILQGSEQGEPCLAHNL